MPHNIIAQMVALVTIIVGWIVLVAGSTLAFIWFDKAAIMSMLPSQATQLSTIPNYVFWAPAACVFVIGLVIAAIGHTLQVTLGGARYPVDDVGTNQRGAYDF